MTVFDLVASLSLDANPFEEGIKAAESKFKALGGALGKVAKVGAGAIAAASTAVAGFGVTSIKAGMDFDSSMSQVAATMGYSVDEINDSTSEAGRTFTRLRDFAQEMGSTTAFSATQAADALNYMALAGYDADKSVSMLPSVLNLAAAGGMELARASDMVTDAQTALGLTMEQTSTMVDQMAMTASKSNTSVAQLGDAILTIGATARNVAGGTTELATVLGVLADNGIKGAEGGTHLRNIILSLQTPTKSGIEAFKQLGMSYEDMYDAAGNMRSLPEIFNEMSRAMDGWDQKSKDAVTSGIFNKTDLSSVNALLGTSSERFDELAAAIGNADGAAQDMANTQLDNLAGDITLFKSALEGAQIAISDGLTPSLREFVQWGTDGLSRMTSAFKSGGIDGLMDELGTVLSEGIGKLNEAVPSFVGAGMKLLSALGEGLVQNLPSLLDAAIETGSMLVEGVVSSLPRIGEMFSEIGPQLIDAAHDVMVKVSEAILGYDMTDDFASFLDGIWDITTEVIPRFVASGLEWAGGMVQGLLEGLPSVDDLIGAFIDTVVITFREWAPGITEAVVSGLGSLTQGIVEFLGSLGPKLSEALPELIETGLNMLVELSGSLRENAGLLVDAALDLIMHLADGLIQALPVMIETIPTIVSNIAMIINENAPKLIETGLRLIGKLIEGIIGAVPTLIAEFPKIVTAIFNVITAVNWLGLGMNIINGIVNGVKSLAANLPTAIKNIGNTAVEWLSAIDWKTLGADIIDLIKIGIESLVTAVPTALKNIGTEAWNAFKGIDWIKLGGDVISGLVSGLTGGISRVVKAAQDVASGVVGALKGVLGIHSPSRVAAWMGRMTDEGMSEGLISNIGTVDEAARMVADSILGPLDVDAPMLSLSGTAGGGSGQEFSVPRSGSGQDHPSQMTVVLELDKVPFGRAVFDVWKDEKEKRVAIQEADIA